MVGIALLGAGIFALEEHLPAIAASSVFELKAVYSRSEKSATGLADVAKGKVDVYFDTPAAGAGRSLDDLLTRDDISTVLVCLPISVQPDIIRKAIVAGKHVLSEKPVAKDLAEAHKLVDWYNSQASPPLWGVAENFRFIKSLEFAVGQIHAIGGRMTTFRLSQNNFVTQENKYYKTDWRKTPQHQGGFVLDAGVHFMAALRLLLSAVGEEIAHLVAFSSLLQKHLAPVDSIHAVASTAHGLNGTICLSSGTEFKSGLEIEIVTTQGAVIWTPTAVTTVTKSETTEKTEETRAFVLAGGKRQEVKPFVYENGVVAEVEAFGRSVTSGVLDSRQTPMEAIKDLGILESMFKSGDSRGTLQKVCQ